jgi:hypothetical protein
MRGDDDRCLGRIGHTVTAIEAFRNSCKNFKGDVKIYIKE